MRDQLFAVVLGLTGNRSAPNYDYIGVGVFFSSGITFSQVIGFGLKGFGTIQAATERLEADFQAASGKIKSKTRLIVLKIAWLNIVHQMCFVLW